MPDGEAKYNKANDLEVARKEANDCFLDMTNLIGGFLIAEDIKPVADAFMAVYNVSAKLHDAEERLADAELDLADATFAIDHSKKPEKAKAKEEKEPKAIEQPRVR